MLFFTTYILSISQHLYIVFKFKRYETMGFVYNFFFFSFTYIFLYCITFLGILFLRDSDWNVIKYIFYMRIEDSFYSYCLDRWNIYGIKVMLFSYLKRHLQSIELYIQCHKIVYLYLLILILYCIKWYLQQIKIIKI